MFLVRGRLVAVVDAVSMELKVASWLMFDVVGNRIRVRRVRSFRCLSRPLGSSQSQQKNGADPHRPTSSAVLHPHPDEGVLVALSARKNVVQPRLRQSSQVIILKSGIIQTSEDRPRLCQCPSGSTSFSAPS